MREENHADTWTEISYLETFKHRTRSSKQHHMPVTSSTRQPRAWNPRCLVVSVIPTTYSQLRPETHTQLEPSARSAFVPFGFCQAKVPAQEELVLPMFHHQNTKATENRRTRFSGTSLEDLTTTSALLTRCAPCSVCKGKGKYRLADHWLADSTLPTRRCICHHSVITSDPQALQTWRRWVTDTQLSFCWTDQNINFRVYALGLQEEIRYLI